MDWPSSLEVIDVHAEGELGRVVLNASRLVGGTSMAERLAWCRAHLDGVRRFVLREPRGFPGACAVFLLPAVSDDADFGIVVLEQGGFAPMSGSNTMCAVAGAVAAGVVAAPREGELRVTIDTAVGIVRAMASIEDGRVVAVTVVNVPAFVVGLDVELDVPEYGRIDADIVFGGQFFAQVRARDLGLDLHPRQARALARAGAAVRLAALEQVRVSHPEAPGVDGVSLVMLHDDAPRPGAVARNTVVLTNAASLDIRRPDTWSGMLDRSPCGTGTCGRMAAQHRRGQLGLGEAFAHRSIIGSEFVGRLTGTTRVGEYEAVLPSVTGRTWIAARGTLELDPTDPFPEGFSVPDVWPPLE